MSVNSASSRKPVQLSPVESYFWRFDGDLTEFRVCTLCRLEGRIEESVLETALLGLQRRHPKLQARITQTADGTLFYAFPEPTPRIPYAVREYDGIHFPWREETRRVLESPFQAGGPLASVVVLRSRTHPYSELLFCSTHAFTDGLSSLTLAENLLNEYAKAECRVDTTSDPVMRIISGWYVRSNAGWRGPWKLLRRFARLKRTERRTQLSLPPHDPSVAPLSQWVHWVLSAEETIQLVRRLRTKKTSLNAVLITAVFFALRDTISRSDALFRYQLPFNVREWLKEPTGPVTSQDIGCFITNMNGFVKLEQKSSFWEVARNTHEETEYFVTHGGPTFSFNSAAFLYDLSTRCRRLFGRSPRVSPAAEAQRVTMLANNYGVVPIRKEYGSLRVRSCNLMFKNQNAGPALILQALVVGQELNLGLAADRFDPTVWDRLHKAVLSYLRHAAGSDGHAAPSHHQTGSANQVEVLPQRIKVAAQE